MKFCALTTTFLLSCALAIPAAQARKNRASKRGKAGVRWIAIPGGSFKIGVPTGRVAERQVHTVKLRRFFMTRTEVTVVQYRACVRAGKCTKPNTDDNNNWGKKGMGRHPINGVDWYQARAFCRWVGGRLPSEAEWEYAARSAGRPWRFPWGDAPATCERAVFDDKKTRVGSGKYTAGCGRDRTWPVCSKPKGNTAQGLCDMAGNVAEWIEDCWHRSYAGGPTDGSAWTKNCHVDARGDRGGGYGTNDSSVRTTFRFVLSPRSRHDFIGLRCVK